MESGRRVKREGKGMEGKEHSPGCEAQSVRRTPPSTLKGLHLDQLAHDARTVVPPDPDDQSV